jgi:DNA ligase D-like protein (predicted 3'-phosphoesterase)
MKRPASDSLHTYRDKRDFSRTPEPAGQPSESQSPEPTFVVQMHAARSLHWDLRLEIGGTLKSWAVPKGPSGNPADKRLAVATEDHPLEYADFEGTIPQGEYGAGTVLLWDRGTFRNDSPRHGQDVSLEEAFERGRVLVWLEGQKLRGGFALIHSKLGGDPKNWLLIKSSKDEEMDPEEDVIQARPQSVLSGKTMEEMQSED